MKGSLFWLLYYEPGKTLPRGVKRWMRSVGYLPKEMDEMTKLVRAVIREEEEEKD